MSRTRINQHTIEAEVAFGLEDFAKEEIAQQTLQPITLRSGALVFDHSEDFASLFSLRTVNSLYMLLNFAVPRPRALLGHEHMTRLMQAVALVRRQSHPQMFHTFSISAAGSDSSVMQRLKEEISRTTGLGQSGDNGDLLIRIRPAAEGWDVLLRLTPRPLATRRWRTCNFEGALNGPVAYCMARMTQPHSEQTYVNIACGSGTLLIERLTCGPAKALIGIELEPSALACAHINIGAASADHAVHLIQGDAAALPLPTASVDALTADLPFGNLVGSHQNNLILYPAVLEEAARIAKPDARFALISHEVRLLENLLSRMPGWSVEDTLKVELRGLHPRIFLLRRTRQPNNEQ